MNLPARALVTQSTEGGFALDLANGMTWSRRFFAGPENALVARALDDVAASLARRGDSPYNPLVLCGPTGSGKTHLAHGLARRVAEADNTAAVVYETGGEFADSYADAVEQRGVLAWRAMRREAHLLVLDNLAPLSAKTAAQIELLHTIDCLLAENRQIVVTSPELPASVPHLLPALASRLTAGLCVTLALPQSAARRAALAAMAAAHEITLDDAARAVLADELPVTMPELSGILHELAIAAGPGRVVDRPLVAEYLRSRAAQHLASLGEIAAATARHFAMRVADLRGPSRRQNIVQARAVAMYIARQITGKSLSAVGSYFGGRDHTTVLHGCRKTEELMTHDAALQQTVTELRAALTKG